QGKAQAAAKAVRLRKDCNAAMGAKARFHVSIFSGCSTSALCQGAPGFLSPLCLRPLFPGHN
ncbi:MAG: hypothetical protein Q7K57_25695, partial [Burkholderiaceae bacterium]|nr:hypothetical protein [Burkholderiaceae bacterium]